MMIKTSLLAAALLLAGAVQAQTVQVQTSMGNFRIQLNAEMAPKSVANFLQYVKTGHYNGTVFHRVIPDFMIQGGGFTKDMVQARGRRRSCAASTATAA